MLRTEKEINDFLFAAGIKKEERADIIRTALSKTDEEQLHFIIREAENAGTEDQSGYFQHVEDEELWCEVNKLEFNDRAALLLPYFIPGYSSSEVVLEKLRAMIKVQIGYELTTAQLERMVQIMIAEVKKRPPEEILVLQKDQANQEKSVQKRSPINKWLLITAGLFVLISGVLLFQNPGQQAGETTFAPMEPEGILEEELADLNQKVDEEIRLLSEELGLSIEAVWQLEFVSHVLSQVNSLQELTDFAETEEERASALSEVQRTEQLVSSRLISPLGKLSDTVSRISAESTYGILETNDNLLSRFTYDASGMIELYENALEAYEDELMDLNAQLSDFNFSEGAQLLIEKIEANGFEVTILPDRQSFDVNYGEDAINRAMNGFLVDEYLDIIKEQKKHPYVDDGGEIVYSYEQQAVKLFQTEALLARSAGTETLSSELLFHHTLLFQHFMRDTTDESGQLKPEIRELWEAIVSDSNKQNYTTARYIAGVYEAFENNNFTISDEVRSVTGNYTLVPVSYRIKKSDAFFPLSDTLQERYNMLNAFGDQQDISFFLPREAVQLYINSLILNNQEVTAMITVPDTFDINEDSIGISMQANEITSIQTEFGDSQAVVTLSGENFTERQIVMQEINGVWKAEFDPEHLEWF